MYAKMQHPTDISRKNRVTMKVGVGIKKKFCDML